MFPDPRARPARQPVPMWSVATGAIVLVVALLVGVLVASGGDHATPDRADASATNVVTPLADIEAVENSLLTLPDMGSEWTITNESGLLPDELAFTDTCSAAPGLQSTATFGRGIDFAKFTDSSGHEQGHVIDSVRVYPTAQQAEAQYQARLDPSFVPCVAQFDREFTECTCQTASTDLEVEALAPPRDVRAAVYRGTVAFEQGGPHQYYLLRAYLANGRYLASVVLGNRDAPPDPVQFETMLRTQSQRLTQLADASPNP